MSFVVGCVLGSKALLLVTVNSLTLSSPKKPRVRAAFNISLSCVLRESVSSKPNILSNMVLVQHGIVGDETTEALREVEMRLLKPREKPRERCRWDTAAAYTRMVFAWSVLLRCMEVDGFMALVMRSCRWSSRALPAVEVEGTGCVDVEIDGVCISPTGAINMAIPLQDGRNRSYHATSALASVLRRIRWLNLLAVLDRWIRRHLGHDLASLPPDLGHDLASLPPDLGHDLASLPPDLGHDLASLPLDLGHDLASLPLDLGHDLASLPLDLGHDLASLPQILAMILPPCP
eukprot:Em0002g1203a